MPNERAAHNGHIVADWTSMSEWITTSEAVEMTGYDIQHVRFLARQGKIGAVKKGRDWWIDRNKLQGYVDHALALESKKYGPRSADGEN